MTDTHKALIKVIRQTAVSHADALRAEQVARKAATSARTQLNTLKRLAQAMEMTEEQALEVDAAFDALADFAEQQTNEEAMRA